MNKIFVYFSLIFSLFSLSKNIYSFESLKGVLDSNAKTQMEEDFKINAEKFWKGTPPGRGTVKNKSSSTLRSSSFSNPLSDMYVTSSFGSRKHPIVQKILNHGGVDLRSSIGTAVKASSRGTVTYAGNSGNYGKLVILKHDNGFETRYAHLSKIKVHEGQQVVLGQSIALSGNTGRSTGPHLHFEVRKNGKALNPLNYLNV